jgi:KAP family P-loop domain
VGPFFRSRRKREMRKKKFGSAAIMGEEQKRTLSMLSPITTPAPEIIVPRTNLPEELRAEIAPSDPVKIFVAGQRGMGKTTELRRFVSLLEDSEFLPIFLQFGAQERIDHPSLIRLMAKALQAEEGSAIDGRVFERVSEWYTAEETVLVQEEGRQGKALIGGKLLVAEASGGILSKRMKSTKKTSTLDRTVAALVDHFNSCIEAVEKESGRRLVFVVDDIDKVQDADSVSSTFIHASHLIGSINCACIFTVPITYATSNYVRIAGLPYNGIHRVPAVALFDEKGNRNSEAQRFMEHVFELRMPYNPVPKELLDKVLDFSGGVLIDAMRILRGICKRVIMDTSLKVDAAVVDEQCQQLVDDYQFVIDSLPLWQAVAEMASSQKRRTLIAEGLLPDLLYKMIVIEYRQNKAWFNLHPAAKLLYEQNKDCLDLGTDK